MNYQPTSREAWKHFLLSASPRLDDMIIAYLRYRGADGAVCEEIETALERKHQAVSGNLRRLVKIGAVEHNGELGKTTSGRSAMKWVIAVPKPRPTTDAVQIPLL